MWQKKNHKDSKTGLASPLPTQIVGNEEILPMPQTAAQRRVEARIFELADQNAKALVAPRFFAHDRRHGNGISGF
jgi:hypothetical protein